MSSLRPTLSVLLLLLALDASSGSPYEAPEPYEYLKDFCVDCNPSVEWSPDPLVAMTWNPGTNSSQLQIYRVGQPMKWWSSSVKHVKFLETNGSSLSLLVFGNCTVTFDWGVERAAWMELMSTSTDLARTDRGYRVHASISEFNQPYPGKTLELTKYGNHTYRLETNPELYEGVRFSFLHFEFYNSSQSGSIPIAITGISLVAKTKPINYTGSFTSSDPELTRAWYTGAYGVRLNMEEDQLNSILIERGDRVAIQGDGHPTIDAALVAFSPYQLIQNVLRKTDSANNHVVDDSIMAYPLYWCLSAMDYFMASGDLKTFQTLMPDIQILLDRRIDDFMDPYLDITWFGWDDRLGNGWCFHQKHDQCTRESLLAFAGLVVRVCNDFAQILKKVNMSAWAQTYEDASIEMTQHLRNVPEWPTQFGVHAAANAINAGIATMDEIKLWMSSTLNDPITICSFSQFNQYWILQGYGNADQMEHALSSIKLCWGPMMKLGKGCFWEMFVPDWTSFMKEGDQAPHLPSYCHPWSSGVTSWLSHVMGGIQAILPGYAEFVATPYVSLHYPFVSTSLSTPHGTIVVNATLSSDEGNPKMILYRAVVTCPTGGIFGVRSLLRVDRNEDDENDENNHRHAVLQSILINGVPGDQLSTKDGISMLGDSPRTRAHTFVRMQEMGTYSIEAVYHHHHHHRDVRGRHKHSPHKTMSPPYSKSSPFPEPKYPASIRPIDRHSQGDGLWVYGDDGYILLGSNSDDSDREQLPWYISSVSIRRHGFPGWFQAQREFVGTSTDNPVYLPVDPKDKSRTGQPQQPQQQQRVLGQIQEWNHSKGGDINCLFVDIALTKNHTTIMAANPILVSVYMVATSHTDKHVISTKDLDSFNTIAPTTLISEYQNGVWWTVEYHRSLRLKLMTIHGIHISAIAFSHKTYETC